MGCGRAWGGVVGVGGWACARLPKGPQQKKKQITNHPLPFTLLFSPPAPRGRGGAPLPP